MMRRLLAGPILFITCCNPTSQQVTVPDPSFDRVPEQVIVTAVQQARQQVLQDRSSAAAWGHYADLLAKYGWVAEARTAYQQATNLDAEQFIWPYRLALQWINAEPSIAEQWLREALALDQSYAPAWIHLARTAVEQSQQVEAMRCYEKALALEATNVDALLGLARLEANDGHWDSAKTRLSRALELEPEHSDLHETLSRVQFALGNQKEAERSATLARAYKRVETLQDPRAAAELPPLSSRDFLNHGVRAVMEGRYEDAVAAFTEARRQNPDNYEVAYNLALASILIEDFEAAESWFRLSINLHPDYIPAHMRLGRMLTQIGKSDDARTQFYRILELDPRSALAHRYIGESYANEGDLNSALMHSEKALALEPNTPAMRYQYAFQLMEAERYEAAVPAFEHLLELEPNHYMGHNNLGIVLGHLDRDEEALPHFRFCLKSTPDAEGVKQNFAIGAGKVATQKLEQGLLDEAVALFNESVANSTRFPEFQRLLAWCLAVHPDEAIRDGARALELARHVYDSRPEDPDHVDTLSVAYAAVGDFDLAIAYAKEAKAAAKRDRRDGLARRIERRIRRFEKGKPYVQNGE